MPSEYGSKKTYGKQKTYGKTVKTHVNGWFGRSLWTDVENDKSVPEPIAPSTERDVVYNKDRRHTRFASESLEDLGAIAEIGSAKEPGQDVDSIADQLENLGIYENGNVKIEQRRLSIVVAEEFENRSSASSIWEGSDKENEGNSTIGSIPSTPLKTIEPETTSLEEPTPRSVLAERDSTIKESPPRKRGLRKRISESSNVSSPLKNEFSNRGVEARGWDDPIKVWEDTEIQDSNLVRKSREPSFSVVIPSRGTAKAPTSRRDHEEEKIVSSGAKDEIPSTPEVSKPQRQSDSVLVSDIVPESEESPLAPIVDASDGESELSDLEEYFDDKDEEKNETDHLLQLCTDQEVVDFTEIVDTMLQESSIRKLGEASYSEVFLKSRSDSKSSTVLKIIPFGQEEQCEVSQIIQEVRITKAMGEIEGFIGFRGAYVAQGFFPETLLDEWDIYDEARGSENERPEFYEEDQLFAIIMLENGGTDLEHTELRGWEEAIDVFWQVAFALARGEKEREFEHRDLHYGNIVIQRKEPGRKKLISKTKTASSNPEDLLAGLTLEDGESPSRVSNLKVALIDYTLSRAYCGDHSGQGDVEFMPLDDEALFTGKGDYQFDIYRFMRNLVTSGEVPPEEEWIDWNVYVPRTNVFWLHYLTNTLINKMGIPRPAARGRNAASEKEKECYKQLDTVHRLIDPRKKRFGNVTIEAAGDIVAWAVDQGFFEHGV